jgi:hypothetical protein
LKENGTAYGVSVLRLKPNIYFGVLEGAVYHLVFVTMHVLFNVKHCPICTENDKDGTKLG